MPNTCLFQCFTLRLLEMDKVTRCYLQATLSPFYLQATLSPWSKITVFITGGSVAGGRDAEIGCVTWESDSRSFLKRYRLSGLGWSRGNEPLSYSS